MYEGWSVFDVGQFYQFGFGVVMGYFLCYFWQQQVGLGVVYYQGWIVDGVIGCLQYLFGCVGCFWCGQFEGDCQVQVVMVYLFVFFILVQYIFGQFVLFFIVVLFEIDGNGMDELGGFFEGVEVYVLVDVVVDVCQGGIVDGRVDVVEYQVVDGIVWQ